MSRLRLTALSLLLIALWAPPASGDQPPAKPDAIAVLAGGCFWGVEAVFEHVRGVRSVTSGYARYANSSSVEAVRIIYDPTRVTYRQLLEIFFLVVHDPTSRDRQGPDVGPGYRAVVLFQNPEERRAATDYVAELTDTRRFARPIVTEVQPLQSFRVAEPHHQNYAARHPNDPYIVQNDIPKLLQLQHRFPRLHQKERSP